MAKLAPVKMLLRHSDDMVEAEDDTKYTSTDQFWKKKQLESYLEPSRSIYLKRRKKNGQKNRICSHISGQKPRRWSRAAVSFTFSERCICTCFIAAGTEGRTQVSSGEFHMEAATPPTLLPFPENLINKTNLLIFLSFI